MPLTECAKVHVAYLSAANLSTQAPLCDKVKMFSQTNGMEKKRRRGKEDRSPEELEDMARLNALWDARPPGVIQATVAEKLGVNPSLISQHLTGYTALTWEAVVAYAEVLNCSPADISPRLAKKNLPKRKSAPRSATVDGFIPFALPDSEPISVYHPEDELALGEFGVPAVNIRVGAGSSIVSEPVEVEALKRYSLDWARKYGLKPERLVRYQVRGNSMEPIIADGAWILVELGDFPINDGQPYLIRAGDEVQVKFLFRRPDGGVIIRSHNPAHPDVQVPVIEMHTVSVLGRVVEHAQMWIKPVNGNGRKG